MASKVLHRFRFHAASDLSKLNGRISRAMIRKQGEVYRVDLMSSSGIALTRVKGIVQIDDLAWFEFASETARDPSLTETQPAKLKARWAAGNAAVTIHNEKIVSYASTLPLYTDQTRGILGRRYSSARITPTNVAAFATAWTAPQWRGFGFSVHLHQRLWLAHSDCSDLIVGLCHGLGASRVIQRLKFKLVRCQDAAFVSALSAWYESGGWHSRRGGSTSRKFFLPPCTGIRPFEMDSHRWQECAHYWVSDASVAYSLNEEFRELTRDDLSGWRHLLRAIPLDVTDTPESNNRAHDQYAGQVPVDATSEP